MCQKGVQPTAAWDAEREGGGMGGVQYCRRQYCFCREAFRGCKGSKRGMGQKQGIEVLCHMRQTLHWLLSGALVLLKGSTVPA